MARRSNRTKSSFQNHKPEPATNNFFFKLLNGGLWPIMIVKQFQLAWRRFWTTPKRRNTTTSRGGHVVDNFTNDGFSSTTTNTNLNLSPRLRYVFIIVAFVFLALASFILLLVLINHDQAVDDERIVDANNQPLLWRLKIMLNHHRTIVIFLSSTFAMFQLVAIMAAVFNWQVVLFTYVIITGIFGTIIGVVGVTGIILTCMLMRHDNHHDHTITITAAVVISFVFVFYLMTILGVRLMEYFRRRNRYAPSSTSSNYHNHKSLYDNLRRYRNPQNNGNNRNQQRRTSTMYHSIDSVSLPMGMTTETTMMTNFDDNEDIDVDNDEDEDGQEQLTQLSLLSAFDQNQLKHQNNNNYNYQV